MSATRLERIRDSKKRATEWETRTTAVNGGEDLKQIAAEGRLAVSFFAEDAVSVLTLAKDGHVAGLVATVYAGDAQHGNAEGLAGLERAAQISEVDTMVRLLDSIRVELTDGGLNPDDLLDSVETILGRIAKKRGALIADAAKRSEKGGA